MSPAPNELTSASNLAITLRALGDLRVARELDEDTLARRRRVLGDDHPHTRTSAGNLADYLHSLGQTKQEGRERADNSGYDAHPRPGPTKA